MPIARLLWLALLLALVSLGCRAPLELPPLSALDLDLERPAEPERVARSDPGELPRMLPLQLEDTEVAGWVIGGRARVRVRQRFRNAQRRMLGGAYELRLPEHAQLDRLEMKIGPRTLASAMQRRHPRDIEAGSRSPATGVFRVLVDGIPPGGEVEVELEYLQALTQLGDELEFVAPLVVGEGSISVELDVAAGVEIERWTTLSHTVEAATTARGFTARVAPPEAARGRDFVIRWRPAAAEVRATLYRGPANEDGEGHFSLLLVPPTRDRSRAREVIFVIDNSASMDPWLRTLEQTVRAILVGLRSTDTFNVFTFGGTASRLYPRSQSVNELNRIAAERFVGAVRTSGGAHQRDVIALLRAEIGPGEQRFVVFLTDGSFGDDGPLVEAAADLVARAEAVGARAQVFGVAIGGRNHAALHRLSAAGNSEAITPECLPRTANARVERLLGDLDQPRFIEVELDGIGLDLDILASGPGEQIGRYRGTPASTPTVRVQLLGESERLEIPVEIVDGDDRLLAISWARERLDQLMGEERRGGLQPAELLPRVTQLGLEYRLVTPATSLVLVDERPSVVGSVTLVESRERILGGFRIDHACGLGFPRQVVFVYETDEREPMLPLGHAAWTPDSVMRIAKLASSAGVDHRALRRSLRERAGELEACHEIHRSKLRKRRLQRRLHFDAGGRLIAVESMEGTLGEAGDRCVEAVLQRVRWQGLPRERALVEVELRLRLR